MLVLRIQIVTFFMKHYSQFYNKTSEIVPIILELLTYNTIAIKTLHKNHIVS